MTTDNANPKQRLVFAIEDNENLGAIIKPFIVELMLNEQFTYNFRTVNYKTITDYSTEVSDKELELLRLLHDYSDEEILKKFSKEKKKVSEFYEQLTDDHFKRLVRPFIDKVITKSIAIVLSAKIPLYFKGKRTFPIPDKPLEIVNSSAEVVFNFIKQPTETHYFQTIKLNDREISLTNKNALLLCSLPCWLLMENMLISFGDNVDGSKLMPFFNKTHIVIPQNTEKKYYSSFVLNTIKHFSVNAGGFSIVDEQAEIKAILSLEINFLNEPVLILKFRYGNDKVFTNNDDHVFVRLEEEGDQFTFYKTKRDILFENHKKDTLTSHGLISPDGYVFMLSHNKNQNRKSILYYIKWINENIALLKANEIEIDQSNIVEKYHIGTAEQKINIHQNQDWFDIQIEIKFGDFVIPFIKLKNHILNDIPDFLLPNGEIAIIPEEWFAKMKNLAKFGTETEKGLSIKKHHFSLLGSLMESSQVEKLPEFKALFRNDKFKVPELEKSLLSTLRNYQKKGIAWLSFLERNKWGGILADDMGLGKTIQAIALLQSFKITNTKKEEIIPVRDNNNQLGLFDAINDSAVKPQALLPSLIVMPLSLVHNWENEIKKFSPDMKVYKHIGMSRTDSPAFFSRYDIVLTTYGTIRNDIEMINDFKFQYLILDESQQIKNPFSKNYAAVKQINALHKIILSGTPIENSLNDLWSQFSIINPGLLGSFSFFKNEFTTPIEKNKNKESQETLKNLINPFILRRTKDEVAKELPPLTEKYHYCEMTDSQRTIYETKKSEIRNLMFENIEKTGIAKSKFLILSGLMKLRLLASHPVLASRDYLYDSGKFQEVIRNLEKLKIENHKVLIFSQFVKHLKLFKTYFDSVYYPYSFLSGDSDYKSRISSIDNFHTNPHNQFFLISLKAGGLGLNLTAADYVFVLDPWWNPSVEMQAINRAHRIGQNKKVMAYKFITKDTIEEKIILLQQRKQKLAIDFINNNNPFSNISQEELADLFQ